MYEGCGHDLSKEQEIDNSVEGEEDERVLVFLEEHMVLRWSSSSLIEYLIEEIMYVHREKWRELREGLYYQH